MVASTQRDPSSAFPVCRIAKKTIQHHRSFSRESSNVENVGSIAP
jgi:hypothetical protein